MAAKDDYTDFSTVYMFVIVTMATKDAHTVCLSCRVATRLLQDRIYFIHAASCHQITDPRWFNFLSLFIFLLQHVYGVGSDFSFNIKHDIKAQKCPDSRSDTLQLF